MSRLNYAPLAEAYFLGSDQIKDTQSEIAKLKSLITDSTLSKKTNETKERIGSSDSTSVSFVKNESKENNLDILKIMQHPKFEDIVKNYVIVKHPEWINSTVGTIESVPNKNQNVKQNFKEYFGSGYSTTVCSNIQNYLMFFIVTLCIYLFLKMVLKN
jgi:hypothetical protein